MPHNSLPVSKIATFATNSYAVASQKIIPYSGIQRDRSELYISEAQAFFIKNLSYSINDNNAAVTGTGENEGVFTPLESNTRFCNLTLPEGVNKCIGYYEAKETNEGYVFVWNSTAQHLIYRLNGNTATCQKVYQGTCLNFQLKPEHFIAKGRCELRSTSFFNKITNHEESRKYLVFTDNFNDQRFISVEDSIATNSFNPTTYPYFAADGATCNRCDWINLGIPMPMDCIGIEAAEDDGGADQDDLPNLMKEKGWQWRIRRTDYWGRQSEWGVISDRYFTTIGGKCTGGGNRCVNLTFDAGCPFDDKFEIAFRNCTDRVVGPSTESDWQLYDTFDKYNNCDNVAWYEREINPELEYNPELNTITYLFCANKGCSPIPVAETNRLFNPLPIRSGSVFNTGNGISLARNVHDREPVDCAQLEKIDFVVTPPVAVDCDTDNILRKITIWAVINSAYNEGVQELRVENGFVVFGHANCSKNNPFAFKQVMPKGQEGFIGYLAGTKHYAISVQYKYDLLTGEALSIGPYFNVPDGNLARYIPIQKFELMVPPGKYIFRLAGHRSSPTEDYQKTSTYLIGQTPLNNIGPLVGPQQFEFLINVCNVDVEIKDNPLMIYDLTRKGKGCAVADVSGVVEGYLREDEKNKYPIELARVAPNKPNVYSFLTDHNGHYFATDPGRGFYVNLYGTKNCANNVFLAKSSTSYENAAEWYRFDDLYAYKNLDTYPVGDRFLVRGHIGLCDTPATGVSGALVILSRGQYAFTDNNGDFAIVAHTVGQTGVRTDNLIYSQQGTCLLTTCDNECVYCFSNVAVTAPACTGSERVVTVANLLVNIYGVGLSGPQMGGRYGLGLTAFDWMGRATFIQALDRFFVDIPSLQQTQVYDYSTIGFTIANNIILPAWVKWINFSITQNLNFNDFITWVAERVQFVDNTGKANSAAPTQIRLYYESLAEYNKQYQYSTNTPWDILTDDEAVVVGDRVQIVANADGTIFNTIIESQVKYDKTGKYFAIDYTDELRGLKDGALIKLIRPKQCETKEFYYELCPMIRVINGLPQVLSGTFDYVDSYLQSRQIPVPVTTPTTNTNPATGEIITTTDNQLRNYPFLFEHHSPSDFWGDHCHTRGRVNTKNPYENQRLLKMEVASSAAISNNGVINGLNYFTEANTFSFDEQQFVGIVCVIPDGKVYLFICEQDNFAAIYNDQSVRVSPNGNVVAQTAENKFGKPERKIGSNYGCNLQDINTIRSHKGLVMWLDRSNTALIQSNFIEASDVGIAGLKSWITAKIIYNLAYIATDSTDKKYFHGCIDPATNEYILSSFNLRGIVNPDNEFLNDNRDFNLPSNETVAYHIYNKAFVFLCFTPEYFGSLQGDSKSPQLLSFRKGEAWYHHSVRNAANDFLNFYGTQCEWVMEPAANLDPTKVKTYMWVEAYVREVRVYADRVVTESGQVSRIMPKFWERFDRFWSAAFLCDLNTKADTNIASQTGINKLLDGDVLTGRWLRVRIVPHPADRNKYCEITAIILNFMGVEKSSDK